MEEPANSAKKFITRVIDDGNDDTSRGTHLLTNNRGVNYVEIVLYRHFNEYFKLVQVFENVFNRRKSEIC